MSTNWQEFLKLQGGIVDGGAAFGKGTQLADLSSLGLLKISGEDACSFLQGQFTNDVKALTGQTIQHSAHCTAKGRMLANFLLWKDGDSYYLQLPAERREGFRKKLTMYVMRSRVFIEDISETTVRIALLGSGASAVLAALDMNLPSGDMSFTHISSGSLLQLSASRYEIVTSPELAPDLWASLRKQASPARSEVWIWSEIQEGVPAIVEATVEEFIPQMVNLEALGGVSFRKGCYTGQEVVARTQHIGQVKRRMYRAHTPATRLPLPGETVTSQEGDTTHGRVVMAAPSPDGGFDLLVVIPVAWAEAGIIFLHDNQGAPITLGKLPYEVAA